MKNSLEQEMLTVRKFNRELLLAILDDQGFPKEERNALTNIMSLSRIKAALAVIEELYKVGYEPIYRSTVTDSMRSASWKENHDQLMKAMEYDNDMVAARGLLINAVRSMCVEQKADLGRLLMIKNFSVLHSFDWYSIQSLGDVNWLPEDLQTYEGANLPNGSEE